MQYLLFILMMTHGQSALAQWVCYADNEQLRSVTVNGYSYRGIFREEGRTRREAAASAVAKCRHTTEAVNQGLIQCPASYCVPSGGEPNSCKIEFCDSPKLSGGGQIGQRQSLPAPPIAGSTSGTFVCASSVCRCGGTVIVYGQRCVR